MIRLEQLSKVYGHGDAAVTVLDRLDFSVATGEIFAVVGPSGAGKSTLAACVNLLERPTSGSVIVNGDALSRLSERELRIARRRIGTVFQSDGLFSRRTAEQNVALPLEYLGVTRAETTRRVGELLERVGLSERARYYPHQLSGGQRQRVGIARALALRPSVLLSDEATSGLDPASTTAITTLLKELRDDLGLSILFITHEMETVRQVADSVARLDQGRIVESGRLVDLLRDASSPLGLALNPVRPSVVAEAGVDEWVVGYARPDVPADWVTRLAASVGPVALLGAAIETIDGQAVGHATVGLGPVDEALLTRAAEALGLSVRPARVGVRALVEEVAA
ncbi:MULTISPECIES: methionine ABC transporter ATP-binding protein [unclassified Rathayibacter]|uniref:methionine ABC transporter ATP-binding protein n=1 Tax=unclassified Rathayibacter TaxID=2609250 RepID=UPI00188BCA35|nr:MULTISPECIES: ATP-binding cassette domain-containing protein [unclassified Rathayibacter]MBF4461125.1 ATP-binding cassette domain-containing protein [Rathayibacter sp. VKM Ac-2879]MBF4502536.1 ATP-binding cassette domain-containing protein [Rathayibacter sp. VKM Ac-2878]